MTSSIGLSCTCSFTVMFKYSRTKYSRMAADPRKPRTLNSAKIKAHTVCKCCESGEVEDVERLVMRCAHVKEEWGKLMELKDKRVEGWPGMEENERVAVAMDKACTDSAVGRAMVRLWRKRFI